MRVNKKWVFDVMPATLNTTLRWHWAKRHKYNEGWFVRFIAEAGRPSFKVKGQAKLRITVYRSRSQDKDNMYGSVKPIVDAIKKLGWIKDDDPKHLDLKVQEVKSKRVDQRTEISLSVEVEEE